MCRRFDSVPDHHLSSPTFTLVFTQKFCGFFGVIVVRDALLSASSRQKLCARGSLRCPSRLRRCGRTSATRSRMLRDQNVPLARFAAGTTCPPPPLDDRGLALWAPPGLALRAPPGLALCAALAAGRASRSWIYGLGRVVFGSTGEGFSFQGNASRGRSQVVYSN